MNNKINSWYVFYASICLLDVTTGTSFTRIWLLVGAFVENDYNKAGKSILIDTEEYIDL